MYVNKRLKPLEKLDLKEGKGAEIEVKNPAEILKEIINRRFR